MNCTCFGHRELFLTIKNNLIDTLENLIEKYGTDTFMTCGMGESDRLFSECIRILKKKYPGIKLILVLPYMTNELNENKEYYSSAFDDIIIPEELMGVHYKAAIEKRNQWMIEQCSVIVDCTYRDFGGAFSAIQYARKKGKTVVSITKK